MAERFHVVVGLIAMILTVSMIVPSVCAVGDSGREGAWGVDSFASSESGTITSSPTGSTFEVKNPGVFIKATIGEPICLDPAVDYETAGGEILQNVYENLLWYDGSSASSFVPVLASSIPTVANGLISPDGLNYTFNLRTGVVFHDSTPMNADDVVYSIQRVLRIHDPGGPGWMLEQVLTNYLGFSVGWDTISEFCDSSAYNVSWIVNALNPAAQGWDHVINENDVKNVAEAVVLKVNNTAVKFRLTHPYPGFLAIISYTVCNIVSKDFVEANGGIVGGEHNTYMDEHTCGTGPYQLVSWQLGVSIHLTKSGTYWGTQPSIDDIYIVKVNDINTRIMMLQAGDADSIDLPITYESMFAGDPNCSITKGIPGFDMTFMTFNFNLNSSQANSQFGGNLTDDFFHDIHMRKAFSHLLNFSLYIQNVARGNAEQPNGVIPKGMFGYNASIPKQEYNLTAAAAEFQLATNINPANGLRWWQSGFTIPLFYNAGNLGRQTACELLKVSLESLGGGPKTATVNTLDWPSYLDQMFNDNGYMPLYVIGWGPDYADPDDYTVPMLDSDYGTYPIFTGYKNDTINVLLRTAASELDLAVRADLYSQMSMEVYRDCPYIWLSQQSNFHIERSWISGYYFNPMYSGLYYPALSKAANTAPIAHFNVTPESGDVTTLFTFNASGSSDIDEPSSALEVRWDWENDGTWDTNWNIGKVEHQQYSIPGNYTVRLEVRDTQGLTNTTTRNVTVTDDTVFYLNLVTGWNFVSVPRIGFGYKASTLGLIAGDTVARWNSVAKTYTSHIVGFPGNDFTILAGVGYWIYVPSGTRMLTLHGTIPTTTQHTTVLVPSSGGWAMIGFSSLKTTWHAADVPAMYNISGSITTVSRWNPATKSYSSWVSLFPTSNNFLLVPGQAYWILCGSSGVLAYDP